MYNLNFVCLYDTHIIKVGGIYSWHVKVVCIMFPRICEKLHENISSKLANFWSSHKVCQGAGRVVFKIVSKEVSEKL